MDIDKTINRLQEIITDVSELRDLVPEWNNMEADELEMSIYESLHDIIKTKHGRKII